VPLSHKVNRGRMATNAQIASAIRTAVLNSGGAVQITIDGMTVRYANPTEALKAVEYYERKDAITNGTRPRAMTINLSHG